jgi:hypothetical protein
MYRNDTSDEVEQRVAAANHAQASWRPMEDRFRRFHQRRLGEVLPAMYRTRELQRLEVKRKHGSIDRKEVAQTARHHWVRQTGVNDAVVHQARHGAAQLDDDAVRVALLDSRPRLVRAGASSPRSSLDATRGASRAASKAYGPAAPIARVGEDLGCLSSSLRHGRTQSPDFRSETQQPASTTADDRLPVTMLPVVVVDKCHGPPATYELNVVKPLGDPNGKSLRAGAMGLIFERARTPRTVAAEYAKDAERRKGETFVLPALTPRLRSGARGLP